jgi:hypothetical protein
MGRLFDQLLTFRILKLLTTKFEDTPAFKAGLIDATGKPLKDINTLTSAEQIVYTALDRLVFRLKRLLTKYYPQSKQRLSSFATALYLIKEHSDYSDLLDDEFLEDEIEELMIDDDILIEEMLDVGLYINNLGFLSPSNFLVENGVPANAVGSGGVDLEPKASAGLLRRKVKVFNVSNNLYSKFIAGKKKYTRWSNYIDMTNEGDKELYDYARKNHRAVIILQNSDNGLKKAIRFNRYGGGSWHKIERK